MHVPVVTPREVSLPRPTKAWLGLVVWNLVALVLLAAPLLALVEFVETWPGGVWVAAVWLCVQAALSLWWLHRVWLDPQTQLEAMGLARAVLAQGMVVPGRVLRLRRGSVFVGYRAPDGVALVLEHRWRSRRWCGLRVGETVPVVLDPRQPEDAVVPQLLGATFDEARWRGLSGDEVALVDGRPERVVAPAGRVEVEPFDGVLAAFPERVRRNRLIRALDRIEGVVRRARPLVMLRVDAAGVTLVRVGEPARTVRWDAPFVVHRSVQLLDASQLALTFELQPSASAEGDESDAGLELRVLLPHAAVARSVPLMASRAPFIDGREFARLWPLVRGYAEAHGEVLDDVALPPAPSAPEGVD